MVFDRHGIKRCSGVLVLEGDLSHLKSVKCYSVKPRNVVYADYLGYPLPAVLTDTAMLPS